MTMPPIHHGRDDRPGSGGPGPGLRSAFVFVGVLFTCALIGFWTLRLLGVERGTVSMPAALGIVAVAAVVAAVVTRAVRGR